jgi:3-oxoacyl-[acyl-carrier protein] reductase
MEFNEKIIVVTGGTRGIGRAVSLHFARQGGEVYAAYLSNETAAAALEAEAAALPGAVRPIRADVATAEGANALMETAAAGTGHIDILVNNAGIIRDGFLATMSDSDWDDVVRGNLYPLFHCCKRGARKMVPRRSGAIVNMASLSALRGTAGQTNYDASKGGTISFTRALAQELGPMGIRVNAVAPGLVQTDMIAAMKNEHVENIIRDTALGRIGRAEEVAEAVAFLASSRASFITGQCLVIDGGII